jgi:hypothetical protein
MCAELQAGRHEYHGMCAVVPAWHKDVILANPSFILQAEC